LVNLMSVNHFGLTGLGRASLPTSGVTQTKEDT